jgi:SAM-dependent methyltransferase
VSVTGERVSTAAGGFNPTWQRHRAAYLCAAPLLPDGRVLDLGCGTGHSFELLAPRTTVGVDADPGALRGQRRETVVADMRELPFPDATFASVLSVQSIEHVPDPERVLAEVARVLEPSGTAIFVTPNRLTFARADEIIDPYHHVEFEAAELHALCEPFFESVEMRGLFGSERYLAIVDDEKEKLDALLRRDPLRLRRLVPRRVKQVLYDRRLRAERSSDDPRAAAIDVADFTLEPGPLDRSLDLVAVCRGVAARRPVPPPPARRGRARRRTGSA